MFQNFSFIGSFAVAEFDLLKCTVAGAAGMGAALLVHYCLGLPEPPPNSRPARENQAPPPGDASRWGPGSER